MRITAVTVSVNRRNAELPEMVGIQATIVEMQYLAGVLEGHRTGQQCSNICLTRAKLSLPYKLEVAWDLD